MFVSLAIYTFKNATNCIKPGYLVCGLDGAAHQPAVVNGTSVFRDARFAHR
jgi:hypothetical protein